MAKRFTDTGKWDKEWFLDLPPKLKCAWEFLRDRCDHAGLWSINMKLMSFSVGEAITLQELQQAFEGRIEIINDKKLFVKGFVLFQYGELHPTNNTHKSVITLLKKAGVNQPLVSPCPGALDKDMDKDMDKRGSGGKNKSTKSPPKIKSWDEIKPIVFEKAKLKHGYTDAFCERAWDNLLAYDLDKPFKNRMSGATRWFDNRITINDWHEFKNYRPQRSVLDICKAAGIKLDGEWVS